MKNTVKNSGKMQLVEFSTPINIKLALLWASLMFLYIYNDYFSMYTHGIIDDMANGRLGPLGHATEPVLAGVALMLAIPALMIFLSATLTALVSRRLNVALGLAYTGIEIITLSGAPLFYRIVVVLEIALTVLVVWHALRWPKHAPSE